MTFAFASWRIPGQQLHNKELVVRRLVRESEIEKYRQLIKPNLVTRIRARVVEHSVWNRSDALLVKVVGPDASDDEMNAQVKGLQKPIRFVDKDFGTFTLDRSLKWFTAKTSWNGRKVQLNLAAEKGAALKRALEAARKLWRSQKSWHAKVLAYAVKELLPLKNDLWLDSGERKLSASEFKSRMKLKWISVWPNGTYEFWHDDGDLFSGHQIEIRGSLTKGLKSANIQG